MTYLGGDSLNYETIFRKKQHYVVIPQIPTKKLFINNRLLQKLVEKQKDEWDIFITKYPKDHCVSVVILDFDDKDNPENAFKDAQVLKRYLQRKGLNTIIVRSGRKGVHCYIQIPVHNFVGGELAHANAEPNTWFNQYVKHLIGLYDDKYYQTLDKVNTSAGLGGNIRLINSNHPKGSRCEIIDGEFLENVEPNEWDTECLLVSKNFAEDEVTKFAELNDVDISSNDLIADNDLREIIPALYGCDCKKYNKGYIYCVCPFHNDHSPSLFVDKEKFRCNACGERGNIFTLIKRGDLKLDDTVRVGR